MSTALFFLVPMGMLAVAWSLCFVGCALNTHGFGNPAYTDIVLADDPVAYWPLSDFPGAAPPPPFPPTLQGSTSVGTAVDLSGNGHLGSYLIPPAYASGTTFLKDADPTLNLRQASIVPGDTGDTQNPVPAAVDFEGGYVSIPWAPNSPMLNGFTFEAFIMPAWKGMTGFNWVVFAAQTASTGFAVYINTNNMWEFTIGNGAGLTKVTSTVSLDFINPTYVAVTFDGSTLLLWINPQSQDNQTPPTPTWTPPANSPPITYVPVDPSTTNPVTFFIGAGASQLPPRMQDGDADPNDAPLFPFQGRIQSVALYGGVLDPNKLQNHFTNGMD